MNYSQELMLSIFQINATKQREHAKGSHKICYLLPNQKVLLKDSTALKDVSESFQAQVKLKIDELVKDGIQTPKILASAKFDDCFYMLQEQAPGNSIFVLNPEQVGYSSFDYLKSLNNPSICKDMATKIYNYNLATLKKLMFAPQSHFDKYVSDITTLFKKYNLTTLDLNCSNVFYDVEKAFTIIDIELPPFQYDMTDDETIAEALINPFHYINGYKEILSASQTAALQEHSIPMAAKLIKGMQNNNYQLTEQKLLETCNCIVGANNLPKLKQEINKSKHIN